MNEQNHEIIVTDGYTINLTKRHVFEGNDRIKLTTKETDLLITFLKNRGIPMEREEILDDIWYRGYTNARVVDDTIRRIKKKMPDINIVAVYGYGYRYD